YDHIWEPDRHELSVSFSAQKNHNGNLTREEIAADSIYLGSGRLPAWLTQRSDGSTSSGAGLELDYTRPMGKQGRVELGSSLRRASSRDDQATTLFEEPGSVVPALDESQRIARVQHIGSLYLSLQRRIGKIGIAGGLRGEWVGENVLFPLGQT